MDGRGTTEETQQGAKQGEHVASSQPLAVRLAREVEETPDGVQCAQDSVQGFLSAIRVTYNWL